MSRRVEALGAGPDRPATAELQTPWWATWWGRLLGRCGLTLLSEAEQITVERNEWQRRVSDACEATWTELHGGGAVIYGTLDECVQRIERLTRFRKEASGA